MNIARMAHSREPQRAARHRSGNRCWSIAACHSPVGRWIPSVCTASWHRLGCRTLRRGLLPRARGGFADASRVGGDARRGWREREGTFPVDASGVLPDGKKFNGPAELRGILKQRESEFCRCLTEKMLTYALGRGMDRADRCTIDEIARNLAKNQYRFDSLVLDIVKSDAFQMRRPKKNP